MFLCCLFFERGYPSGFFCVLILGGGGGEITSSSLEDVCSSEVSDIRDLFAFFDLLFIGSDESDSELEPFLFFLFEVLHVLRSFCSGLPSAFARVVGVPFSGTAGTGFLGAGSGFLGTGSGFLGAGFLRRFLFIGAFSRVCRFIDCCDYSITMFLYLFFLQGSLPLRLSMVSRTPAILFSRS